VTPIRYRREIIHPNLNAQEDSTKSRAERMSDAITAAIAEREAALEGRFLFFNLVPRYSPESGDRPVTFQMEATFDLQPEAPT